MVETQINKTDDSAIIVLRPNNSASWRFNMLLTAALASVLFIISTYYALMGLWMIFPFAGLEIIVLIICQYIRLRANHSTETITFNGDDILVKHSCYQKVESWTYNKAWVKLLIRKPRYRGHPTQVLLSSHGKEIELGSFLNKSDKKILIRNLKEIIYA